MQLDVVDIKGNKVGTLEVSDEVFGAPIREQLFWEVVKAQRAGRRAGTHATKTRSFVRGGGKKPFRQKGTGNARQGSTRAAQWVGGGKIFGPQPRSYEIVVPKKVKKAALASAISLRAKEKRLIVVEGLSWERPKTRVAVSMLKDLGVSSALVVDSKTNVALAKSLENLPESSWLPPEGLNVYDILNHPALVIAKEAVRAIEGRFAADADNKKAEAGSV